MAAAEHKHKLAEELLSAILALHKDEDGWLHAFVYKPMNCGGPEAVLKGMSRSTAEFSHNTARLTCDELALLLAHKEELLLHIHGRGVALADGDPALDARFELAWVTPVSAPLIVLFIKTRRKKKTGSDR